MSVFNEKLRTLLANREWTQAQLAAIIPVSTSTVQKWVVGKNMPDAETVKLLSDLFFISMENLLDDDYEVPAYYVIDKYQPYSVAARFPKDQCDSEHVLIDACLAKGAILHRFINGGGDACSAIYYGGREIWWHYRENEARMIKDWNAWCPV